MFKQIAYIADQMYCRFQDDEVTALSAQLTYYLILSFFPFLIFMITLASYTPLADKTLLNDMFAILPESSYRTVTGIVNETIAASNRTLLSVGMVATIWTSSSGMMAIIKGINKAYDSAENRPWWLVRSLSVVYTFVFAVLVVLTFVLLIFGELIGKQLFTIIPFREDFETIWSIGKLIIPLGMLLVAFVLLYMQAPNYRVRVYNAIPGALFATTGWIVASLLFSYYVNNFANYSRTYGSIGGVIVLLVWIYISSIIIIMGGELNATLQFQKEKKSKAECKKYGFNTMFPWLTKKKKKLH